MLNISIIKRKNSFKYLLGVMKGGLVMIWYAVVASFHDIILAFAWKN
jgi:hypothetical protein